LGFVSIVYQVVDLDLFKLLNPHKHNICTWNCNSYALL